MRARPTARRRHASAREGEARYEIAGGPVVVDASMAVLWFANEPDPRQAARLLERDAMLLAPDFMAVEATNAWWKKFRRREMTVVEAEQAVTRLLALDIVWTTAATLLRPAVRLAAELGHPVYDCIYLALAESDHCELLTADDIFARRVRSSCPFIVSLKDL